MHGLMSPKLGYGISIIHLFFLLCPTVSLLEITILREGEKLVYTTHQQNFTAYELKNGRSSGVENHSFHYLACSMVHS